VVACLWAVDGLVFGYTAHCVCDACLFWQRTEREEAVEQLRQTAEQVAMVSVVLHHVARSFMCMHGMRADAAVTNRHPSGLRTSRRSWRGSKRPLMQRYRM
jgi:hypothetical protein